MTVFNRLQKQSLAHHQLNQVLSDPLSSIAYTENVIKGETGYSAAYTVIKL